MKKKALLTVLIVLLLAALVFLAFALRCCPADKIAQEALVSDAVTVEKTDFGWRFDGPSDASALIFYPGGKVEETAYAPLLHSLAQNGPDVFLVKMPLRLAVLGMNRADGIIGRYAYEKWYIGGHSLGGAVAANYAAAHDLDGVVLLAAYPTKDVDEPMLLLYGSEDGVVNRAKIAASSQFGAVEEHVIEGGNHAGFGNYGEQKGDGVAAISAQEQQKKTVEAILAWIGKGGSQ